MSSLHPEYRIIGRVGSLGTRHSAAVRADQLLVLRVRQKTEGTLKQKNNKDEIKKYNNTEIYV